MFTVLFDCMVRKAFNKYYNTAVFCASPDRTIAQTDQAKLENLMTTSFSLEIAFCAVGICTSGMALITLWHETFSKMSIIYSFFLRWLLCANLVDCVLHVLHGLVCLLLPSKHALLAQSLRLLNATGFACCGVEIGLIVCMAGTQVHSFTEQYKHAPLPTTINERVAKWLVVPVSVAHVWPAVQEYQLYEVRDVYCDQAQCDAITPVYNLQMNQDYSGSWLYVAGYIYAVTMRAVSITFVALCQVVLLKRRHQALRRSEASNHFLLYTLQRGPDGRRLKDSTQMRQLLHRAVPCTIAATSAFLLATLPRPLIYVPGRLLCDRIGDFKANMAMLASDLLHYVYRASHAYLYCLVSRDVRVVAAARLRYCLRRHDRPDPIAVVQRRLDPRLQGSVSLRAIAHALDRL